MENLKQKLTKAAKYPEQILKLDMLYIAKGSFWATVRFTTGTMASLITVVAFGNLLSKESYGTYNYLLSLAASLSFLTLSGSGIAVMRATARGYAHIIHESLALQLRYNLITSLLIIGVGIYYGLNGNLVFSYSLFFLSLAYPIAEAYHIYEQFLVGSKRFGYLTKITTIINFISSVSIIATLWVTQDITKLVAVYSATALVPNIIAYYLVVRKIPREKPTLEQTQEMRRTTFHMTGAGLIGTAASYIDKIILFQVAGPAVLATYSLAVAGPERLKGLVKNWLGISLPKLAQRSLLDIRNFFYKRILYSLLIGTGLAITYVAISPILFKIFLPKYLDSIIYSQVYAINLILIPATVFIGSIFASQNMLRSTYIQSTGTYLIRIVSYLILGYFWQIWGLILATIITNLMVMLYSIIIWEFESRRIIIKNANI